MNLTEALRIVKALLDRRQEIKIEADGCDDRFYLSDLEWEAIQKIWTACEQEF